MSSRISTAQNRNFLTEYFPVLSLIKGNSFSGVSVDQLRRHKHFRATTIIWCHWKSIKRVLVSILCLFMQSHNGIKHTRAVGVVLHGQELVRCLVCARSDYVVWESVPFFHARSLFTRRGSFQNPARAEANDPVTNYGRVLLLFDLYEKGISPLIRPVN